MSDDVQIGRVVQDMRIARGLRQVDVAARAGVGRETVSRLERGLVDGLTVGSLRAISRALGMPSVAILGWRSPEIDRLRDRLHAAMVEEVVRHLQAEGWELAPELSFNHFGERGSADVLAWHARNRAVLIVETKSRLWDIQDLLVTLDRKRRLMPGIVSPTIGWRPLSVGVLLVLPEMSTHRHVVARHASTFTAALPDRQPAVRRWLGEPSGNLRGIWFLPISHQNDIGQRSRRRRACRSRKPMASVLRPRP